MIKKPKIVLKNVVKLHKDTVIGLYSPPSSNGSVIYSFSKDGCVRMLNPKEKNIINTLTLTKTGNVKEEKLTNKPTQMAELQKITLEKGEKVSAKEDINAVLFIENIMYGGYERGDIYSWDLKTGEVAQKLLGHTGSICEIIQISPKIIASSSQDNTIRCWDITTGTCENILKLGGSINHMEKHGNVLYVLVEHNAILQLELETYNLLNSLKLKGKTLTTFAINKNKIYLANTDCKIEVYDLREQDNPEPKHVFEGHKDWIHCMKVKDNYLYSGSDDRTVKVWSLTENIMIEEFTDHEDGIVCIEFIGNTFYTGSFDYSIRFWVIDEMFDRIRERKIMLKEDLMSKKYDAYCKIMFKGTKVTVNKEVNLPKNPGNKK